MPPAKKEVRPSSRGGRARTPQFLKSNRGVKNWKEATAWLEWRGIEDIECITPDQAGIRLMRRPVKTRRSPAIHLKLSNSKYHSWKQCLDHAYWDVGLR